ncbi:sensor histidine kinase [Methanobacterium alcaliphilum]|uniref:sensor histidine kinase n=1 Tax=Methanobacterium alcaliphilum TaxID=392018 RepID=UPI00200B3C40|nr:PAS domain S-box protein [Methanobacterium alcaliphilum]MCK9151874.1 PAS domain S-box protein [Methanobacterium alcaliphilum]
MLNNNGVKNTREPSLKNLPEKSEIREDNYFCKQPDKLEHYKNLIENYKDVLARYDLDLRFKYITPNINEYTGKNAEHYLGKTHLESDFFPDMAKVFDEYLNECINTKKPMDVDFSIMSINGLVYANSRIYPEYDLNGNVKSVLTITRDDTHRIKSEKTLKAKEEKYRALFESNPNYIVVIGLDGIIQDVNQATEKVFGAYKEDLIGKNFMELDFIPKDDLLFHYEKVSHLLNHGDLSPYEAPVIDKNGNLRWIEILLSYVKRENDIDNILIICNDINQRRVTEEEIKASFNEKENILSEIHHRVMNNMQIISSLLNLQTQFTKEDNENNLDILKECQNRVMAMAMIHEKLYQSKAFTFIKFDDYLEKMVRDLFKSYNIPNENIKLIIESEDIWFNLETAVPCGLIINELVSNCLKHTCPKEKGEIYVYFKKKMDKYILIISDNGQGLGKNFNLDTADSHGFKIVNNLVDQLRGTIILKKTPGTTFKITFKELE